MREREREKGRERKGEREKGRERERERERISLPMVQMIIAGFSAVIGTHHVSPVVMILFRKT